MKKKHLFITVIGLFIVTLFATSCGMTKKPVKTPPPPPETAQQRYERLLRNCSKRVVNVLDSQLINGLKQLTYDVVGKDESFDSSFAKLMRIVGDSLGNILTDAFPYSDSLDAVLAYQSNAEWTQFKLYVNDATQPRTKELLSQTMGMKQTFSETFTEVFDLSKINLYNLKNEPLSAKRMTMLQTGMVKYNQPRANAKVPAYKDIQNMYLETMGEKPNQPNYSAATVRQFRVEYAKNVLVANLWSRILWSRTNNNR